MNSPYPQILDQKLLETLVGSDVTQAFLKILFVIGGALYIVFAFVVVRQITLMRQTLITSFSTIIQIIGYVHLIFSVLVLLYFLLFL